MSATKTIFPEPGGKDGLGTPTQQWEEIHAKTVQTDGLEVLDNDTSEVWIGQRGIGLGGSRPAGSGSKIDPFDGTTQATFDALMTTHKAVPNRIIMVDDGGYSSNFAWGTSVAAGVKIIGSSGNPRDIVFTNTTKVGRLISFVGDNCHAEGFTVDCNGLGVSTTSAVAIRGNNGTIRKILVQNPCGIFPSECFAIAYFASATSVVGALIEYCEVDSFVGDYGTMIILGIDSTNDDATSTGIVQHNNVHDIGASAMAYGSGGRAMPSSEIITPIIAGAVLTGTPFRRTTISLSTTDS